MSTTMQRPQRLMPAEVSSADINLQPPPVMPRPGGSKLQNMSQMLMYLPMMLGFGGISLITTAQRGGPMFIITASIFGLVIVGMVAAMVIGASSGKKTQLNEERRDYLRYLDIVRIQVREIAQQQRLGLLMRHPEPDGLSSIVVSSRLWERRRLDQDFGQVRVATGPQRLAANLKMPQTPPLDELDPMSSTSPTSSKLSTICSRVLLVLKIKN